METQSFTGEEGLGEQDSKWWRVVVAVEVVLQFLNFVSSFEFSRRKDHLILNFRGKVKCEFFNFEGLQLHIFLFCP